MALNGNIYSSVRTARFVLSPLEFEKRKKKNRELLSEEMRAKTPVEEPQKQKTGWLPGPLSYPWIFIAIGISDLVSPFYF